MAGGGPYDDPVDEDTWAGGEPTQPQPTRPKRDRRAGPGRVRRWSDRIDWDAPFTRLSLIHALGNGGEALLAIALASSLFFKVDPAQGRHKVLLGLLLTMAPFAVVGPLIGPMMDRVRGGHRVVVIASMVLRAVTAAVMVWATATNSFALFPAAFVMLVLGKTYQVARAAVVPSVVHGDAELVEANSKLQVLAGIASVVAAAPGGILFLIGPTAVMVGCTAVFVAASVASFRLPSRPVPTVVLTPAEEQALEDEEATELRSGGIVIAASAMAVLRALTGFVTFLLAFELRGGADLGSTDTLARNVAAHLNFRIGMTVAPVPVPPKWYFGVIVALSVVGGMVGAALAPRVAGLLSEERILLGASALATATGVLGAIMSGLAAYSIIAFGIAVAGSAGKQAFDSLVQRDAPVADRGRTFARFESRFQVVWVLGAVIPAAVHFPFEAGAIVVAAGGAFATICDGLGRFPQLSRSGKSGTSPVPSGSSGKS
jgi:hypothetical protein